MNNSDRVSTHVIHPSALRIRVVKMVQGYILKGVSGLKLHREDHYIRTIIPEVQVYETPFEPVILYLACKSLF